MASPAVIKAQMQLGAMDCVVACLAMLLGRSYEDVASTALKVDADVMRYGLTWREAGRVAKLLGQRLTLLDAAKVDLDETTGILYVKIGRTYHAVLVFNGSIYNPSDGLLYLPDVYLTKVKGKAVRLLIV